MTKPTKKKDSATKKATPDHITQQVASTTVTIKAYLGMLLIDEQIGALAPEEKQQAVEELGKMYDNRDKLCEMQASKDKEFKRLVNEEFERLRSGV